MSTRKGTELFLADGSDAVLHNAILQDIDHSNAHKAGYLRNLGRDDQWIARYLQISEHEVSQLFNEQK